MARAERTGLLRLRTLARSDPCGGGGGTAPGGGTGEAAPGHSTRGTDRPRVAPSGGLVRGALPSAAFPRLVAGPLSEPLALMSPALAPTVARDGPLGDFASGFDPFSRVKVAERAAARDDREIADGSGSALPDGLWLLSLVLLALSAVLWLVPRRRRDEHGERRTMPRAPADPRDRGSSGARRRAT